MTPKYRVKLRDKERAQLEQLVRRHSTPQNLVRRARIILLANGEAQSNTAISEHLGVTKANVTHWTKRWIERASESTENRISDLPRSGAPSRITAEQWCKIMALACELPEIHGLPISHWSHKELRNEILKQGIVEQISVSHVGTFLKQQNFNLTAVATG